MTLEAIKFQEDSLEILDQRLLPLKTEYIPINNVQEGCDAIQKMQVRGAPAIALVGCLSLVVELRKGVWKKDELREIIRGKMQKLVDARPTAVNIVTAQVALNQLAEKLLSDPSVEGKDMKARIISAIKEMLDNDISDNKAIGKFGAESILAQSNVDGQVRILTHCNTGSLATAGYGTALGVIRFLQCLNKIDHVYFTETRPYMQGSRLTAYELLYEKIPSTLICDSAVAALMSSRRISAVVVGADRVAANGDTANKIGTCQIAIVAKHFNVPFYVAAPWTSIDLNIPTGESITVEERSPTEMTHCLGNRIVAEGVGCWNPAFDVTPAFLIEGIITEKGVYKPDSLKSQRN